MASSRRSFVCNVSADGEPYNAVGFSGIATKLGTPWIVWKQSLLIDSKLLMPKNHAVGRRFGKRRF
ncbi:MAG: hypothetical protein A2341_17435 [Deltaproteobacteria bacterium RIFOXYB12_FULL_58_9]|nr:MAG: hypothetical protein A2341_17435 [Deltaproteobacteria bacterium RIFOXYB12_FULL_58_9]